MGSNQGRPTADREGLRGIGCKKCKMAGYVWMRPYCLECNGNRGEHYPLPGGDGSIHAATEWRTCRKCEGSGGWETHRLYACKYCRIKRRNKR